MNHKVIFKYALAIGGFFLILLASQWNKDSKSHCAEGRWVSPKNDKSLEVFKDKIAILDRLTTVSGWKDACTWNTKDDNSIVLKCQILGGKDESLYIFQCGNTNKLGYLSYGLNQSHDSSVMYKSQ